MKRILNVLLCMAFAAPPLVGVGSAADAPRPTASAPSAPPIAARGNRGKKMGDDLECLLEPHLISNVGSPVEGTLREVLVDRGAIVTKGQVIARLNSAV